MKLCCSLTSDEPVSPTEALCYTRQPDTHTHTHAMLTTLSAESTKSVSHRRPLPRDNGGDCLHRAPTCCEELDPPYDINIVSVQRITFVLRKINKNCCHQSCTFSLHTRTFNGPFSGTTRVSRYQKGKANLDLLKQETVSGSGISWAICKSAPRSSQITTPAPHHSVFTGRMPFLPPNQQHQSTKGS